MLRQCYGDPAAVTDELVDLILTPGLQPGAVDVFLDFISYSFGPLPEEQLEVGGVRRGGVRWGQAGRGWGGVGGPPVPRSRRRSMACSRPEGGAGMGPAWQARQAKTATGGMAWDGRSWKGENGRPGRISRLGSSCCPRSWAVCVEKGMVVCMHLMRRLNRSCTDCSHPDA